MSKPIRIALFAALGTVTVALVSHLGGMYLFHRVFDSNAAFSAWWWLLWIIDAPARIFFAATGHGLRFEQVDLHLSAFILDVLIYVGVVFVAWFGFHSLLFVGFSRYRRRRQSFEN